MKSMKDLKVLILIPDKMSNEETRAIQKYGRFLGTQTGVDGFEAVYDVPDKHVPASIVNNTFSQSLELDPKFNRRVM